MLVNPRESFIGGPWLVWTVTTANMHCMHGMCVYVYSNQQARLYSRSQQPHTGKEELGLVQKHVQEEIGVAWCRGLCPVACVANERSRGTTTMAQQPGDDQQTHRLRRDGQDNSVFKRTRAALGLITRQQVVKWCAARAVRALTVRAYLGRR